MTENLQRIARYNPWGGNDISGGFRREQYLQKISLYSGNRLIKVLTGQRRSGKSYILRQIVMDLVVTGVPDENILYVSKEFTAFNFIPANGELDLLIEEYRNEFHPQGKAYIFVDEIQNIDGWEKTVNSLSQDFTWPCEVFISGSNSKMLSGELASLLSGRYVEIEVLPLSFNEWTAAGSRTETKEAFEEYLNGSGLPELLHLDSDEVRRNYVSGLKDTILLKDIMTRNRIRDARTLEDLFTFTVNNATKMFTPNTIVKDYKAKGRSVNYETVSSYLSCIEQAFIIHKSVRYNIQGRETISGNCKYYLNDLGFYNYLYRGFAYGYGYQLENVIYLSLRRAGYDIYTGNIPGRTGASLEVDFIAIKGEERLYVQVAYEMKDAETLTREYRPLELIEDNYPKYVVTMDSRQLPNKNGIRHIQAWKFDREIANLPVVSADR